MLTTSLDSKIDLLDSADSVTKKVKKAECFPKVVEGNGVLALVEYVLLPGSVLRTGTRQFTVERHDADPLVYTSIEQMQTDFTNDVVCAWCSRVLWQVLQRGILTTLSTVDTSASQARGG